MSRVFHLFFSGFSDESFEDRKVQSVADYLNYACTWSAYQAHLKENPEEAKGLIARLTSA